MASEVVQNSAQGGAIATKHSDGSQFPHPLHNPAIAIGQQPLLTSFRLLTSQPVVRTACGFGTVRDVLGSVPKIQDVVSPWEIPPCQVPDPLRSIAQYAQCRCGRQFQPLRFLLATFAKLAGVFYSSHYGTYCRGRQITLVPILSCRRLTSLASVKHSYFHVTQPPNVLTLPA